ncbi:hypothetical protein E2C01_013618 [Portunus trituberculatus]|uniref:Uncharacterized protein n=1 Tax=Portunus trituberculatus TaxID=210409 RepID=A0A5B7DHI5_PORTR|nr:hypothetical protein [Portunus trituberculatus]
MAYNERYYRCHPSSQAGKRLSTVTLRAAKQIMKGGLGRRHLHPLRAILLVPSIRDIVESITSTDVTTIALQQEGKREGRRLTRVKLGKDEVRCQMGLIKAVTVRASERERRVVTHSSRKASLQVSASAGVHKSQCGALWTLHPLAQCDRSSTNDVRGGQVAAVGERGGAWVELRTGVVGWDGLGWDGLDSPRYLLDHEFCLLSSVALTETLYSLTLIIFQAHRDDKLGIR